MIIAVVMLAVKPGQGGTFGKFPGNGQNSFDHDANVHENNLYPVARYVGGKHYG